MDNIKWEPVDVSPRSAPRGKPYARVTTNSISFNAAACDMIDNIEQYSWAVVRVGTSDNEPSMLGFQFIKNEVPGAFPVKKQSQNHKGVTFFSRELVKRYFGIYGVGVVLLRQEAEKIDDTTLAVHLLTDEQVEQGLGYEIGRKVESFVSEIDTLFSRG